MSYLIIFVGLSKIGFKISITSDGQHYSQDALFIVSDGYCTTCTASGVCTQKVWDKHIFNRHTILEL